MPVAEIANKTDLTGLTLGGGRYEVTRRLGSGSMGHVFIAFDTRLKTEVVVKVPTLARLEKEEFRRRFVKESEFLVRLNHPHVVNVLDVDEVEGSGIPYFVMPFIGGGCLSDRLELAKISGAIGLDLDELTDWLLPIAQALDFLHDQNVIHRDVKPGNILFDAHGNPFLSDFGLSKLLAEEQCDDSSQTAAGSVVGTPNYVAPELVLGHKFDGRADQYSLAIAVFEILSGKAPFEGPTASATMVNQTTKKAPLISEIRPEIPERWPQALSRGMAKRPQNRFPTCSDFASAILECVNTSAARQSAGYGSGETVFGKAGGPQYAVLKTSRGKPGRVPCPKCKKVLIVKREHAGKVGKCGKCKNRVRIGKSLDTLKLLKLVSPGPAGQSSDATPILSTEVFGHRLSVKQAIGLAASLGIVLIIVSIWLTYYFSRPEEEKPSGAGSRETHTQQRSRE